MDFALDADQEALRDAVRRLMEREAPEDYLRKLDEQTEYPYELYARWAEAGFLGLPIPEDYGGIGAGVLDFAVVAEEIGRWGYDLAGIFGVPLFIALTLLRYGTEEQKREFIPAVMAGRRRLVVSMTEPDAGSDVSALRTTARRRGDSFVINGQKLFCSGAGVDDTTIAVYCRTNPDEPDHRRAISCFLVDNTTPGLTIAHVPVLGRKWMPTTQLYFDDVEVPADRLLGELHQGWETLLSGLRLERIVTSAGYVGNAQTVVDEALAYAKERRQFGRRIGDFQAIAHLLADMQCEVDASRLLTYRAAWMLDRGEDALLEVSIAKLFGSEAFLRIARNGVQIMGGYGYSMESPMQRHLRAAVASTITAGTSQIQRDLIARKLGLRPR